MGILLGLGTALSWGVSDFLARFATRRIGTLRTTFYMQATGFLILSYFLFHFRAWGHLFDGSGWRPWAWGVLAGGMNACSTLSLYRSFEVGRLAVVAPISASYPALTMALAMLTGERLTAARAAGIALTVFGVILVATGEPASGNGSADEGAREQGKRGAGILWALLAALEFGVLFWVLGIRVVPRTGPYAAVWMIRLTSMLATGAVLAFQRRRIALQKGPVAWQLWGMGILDTGAFVMNNRGMQLEQVSVVTVLSSLYGAVTVGLAALVLRERLHGRQWAGIAAIFAGIYLISR
ncbi:MAG TPA: DMT family transporter [Candidatus Acidoferrales bacterium]|nr:DMT family transporter [Candidatus Acidoferrales bacterium]